MITSKQIAAGRALLGISQAALAQWAGLSRATVSGIEADYDCKSSSLRAVQQALEARGVRFTPTGGIEQLMQWRDPVPDRETRRRLTEATNMLRSARHNPPVVDPLEDE
jgi:predicted transcriptional regulator